MPKVTIKYQTLTYVEREVEVDEETIRALNSDEIVQDDWQGVVTEGDRAFYALEELIADEISINSTYYVEESFEVAKSDIILQAHGY